MVPCAGIAGDSVDTWLMQPPKDANGTLLPPQIPIIDLNLTGVIYMSYLALYHFQNTSTADDASSTKQIIFISSLAGYTAPQGSVIYSASKFGVRGIWKSLRQRTDVLGEGLPLVRYNLIAPTFVRTPMTAGMQPMVESVGIKFCEIADVVEGVIRLASDESIFGE